MTKEEVYKLIQYDGKYDEKVKKNLKSLIKKYHPDKNKDDNKMIKVIYEVKKELENNQVSYNMEKQEVDTNEYIDKNKCIIKIEKLSKEKEQIDKKLKKNYIVLSDLFKEYSDLYETHCKKQNNFCEIKDQFNKNNKLKTYELLIYFGLIFGFIYCFMEYHTLTLICVFMLIFFSIYINYKRYIFNKKIKLKHSHLKDKLHHYDVKIKNIREKINDVTEEIRLLEIENTRISNDIRFFKNRFK